MLIIGPLTGKILGITGSIMSTQLRVELQDSKASSSVMGEGKQACCLMDILAGSKAQFVMQPYKHAWIFSARHLKETWASLYVEHKYQTSQEMYKHLPESYLAVWF